MKHLVIPMILSISLLGCKETNAENSDKILNEKIGKGTDWTVYVVHDSSRDVTCYVMDGYKAGGLYCFTDKQLSPIKEDEDK